MDERRCERQPDGESAGADDSRRKSPAAKTYAVPIRFGLGTILLATAMFAVFFAAMKWINAPVLFIVVLASYLACIALAQMIFQRAPRVASAATGVLFHLGFVVVMFWNDPSPTAGPVLRALFFYTCFGALFGYVTGSLIASVFLVTDYLLWAISQAQSLARRSE